MTKPSTPSALKSAGDNRNLVAVDENYVALTFEDRLRIFWRKNGKSIVALVVVALLAVLGKGVWDYRAAQKEIELERVYAAATTPEQVKAFATSHPGHMLAGIARLRVADEDYAAGKSTEAIYGYEDAAAALKSGPLASRARLGLAMARIQAGKTAEGEAALKQLAGDANETKSSRVEAAYQLASLASAAGRADDLKKYTEQVMKIDPASPWLQRTMMLRGASLDLNPSAALAPVPATSAIKLPATGK
jgi:predicted negative regulator of RcsB-dependent stress response